MTRVATSRLMEATASLSPADRALVNLWVNRGLDDAAVARLIGMSEAAIASRRARIVEHLGATLGLPPDHVHAALNEITVASNSANGGGGAVPPPPPGATTAAETAAEPETAPAPRRRLRWGLALSLLAIAAVCVLVVSLASSGPAHRRRPVAAGESTQTAATVPGGSGTSRSPTSGPPGDLLTALPGAAGRASGSVAVSHALKLSLTVRDLTPVTGGHYEIWLYNSLTSSVALGRLRAGVDHLLLPLPRDAGRYRWIDISFQPVGTVFHSGESRLRAANPLFGRAASSGR